MQTTQLRFDIKLTTGNTVQIECEPYQLKNRVNESEFQIQQDCLLLINKQTQTLFTLAEIPSMLTVVNKNFAFEVLDLQIVWKEFKDQKKQIGEQAEKNQSQTDKINDQGLKLMNIEQNHEQEKEQLLNDNRREKQDLEIRIQEQQNTILNYNQTQLLDKKEKENLQNEIVNLQSKIKELEEKNIEAIGTQENIKQMLQQSETRRSNAEDQLLQQTQILGELKNEKVEYEMNIENLSQENERYRRTIRQQTGFIETLSKELEAMNPVEPSYIQQYEIEIQKLKSNLLNLQSRLEQQVQTNEQCRNMTDARLQEIAQQQKEQLTSLTERYNQLQQANGKKGGENVGLQEKLRVKEIKLNDSENANNQQKEAIQSLKGQLNEIQRQIIEYQNKQVELEKVISQQKEQMKRLQEQLDVKIQENNSQLQQIVELKNVINGNTENNNDLTIKLNQQSQELQQLEADKQNMGTALNKLLQQTEEYQQDSETKGKILKKVCKSQWRQQLTESIIAPMEKIMTSDEKVKKFLQNPNCQPECTEYDIYEVTLDEKKAVDLIKRQQLQQQQHFFLDECLIITPKGSIKTTRNLQPNIDVTLLKGYFIKIDEVHENTQKKWRNKILLRKEYKSLYYPIFSTIVEAAKLSINNLFCNLLLQRFRRDIKELFLTDQQVEIQPQFVLKEKGKEEYFYCEFIKENGEYEKVNGGNIALDKKDIHQFLNTFSLYTYYIMNQQLIISNLQFVERYLYDMIVSTRVPGIFPNDQGEIEISTALTTIERNPNATRQYWNRNLETKAKKGFT